MSYRGFKVNGLKKKRNLFGILRDDFNVLSKETMKISDVIKLSDMSCQNRHRWK